MVIERAKRDFPNDIALIGLTGSFSTEDYHEKSDLDLIIINNNDRGWQISSCFILDDVGFDIYCTPWETRIKDQSELKSSHLSCLIDLKVLYWSKQEDLDKFNAVRQKALDLLSQSIGIESLKRAVQWLDKAKTAYADLMISEEMNSVRYASAQLAMELVNTLFSINNRYITQGVKRYLEQLSRLTHVPVDFEKDYQNLVMACTTNEIRRISIKLLKSVTNLYETLKEKYETKVTAEFENIEGAYEELWCNCRHKILRSVRDNNAFYAFHTAQGAQEYINELSHEAGMPQGDLMAAYDPDNLERLREEFLKVDEAYRAVYDRVGREVKSYASFEELYEEYMG